MYKFDEQALRKGINMGLGSQGIWTPELEDVMFYEITNEALRIHNVSKSFYCQSEIEMEDKCDEQCEHCKEYYKPLEQ